LSSRSRARPRDGRTHHSTTSGARACSSGRHTHLNMHSAPGRRRVFS
jgi:hypothetical protein